MLCNNTDNNHLFTQAGGMLQMVQEGNVDGAQQEEAAERVQTSAKKVRKPKFIPMWTEENGTQHPILPCQSYLYNIYVAHPDIDNASFQRKFRLHFRLLYAQFTELAVNLETVAAFARWHNGKQNPWTRQAATAPISLILLEALLHIDRGCTFDDLLAESTAISQEILRVFFHSFIDF
jgi:hypothetical protein